MHMSTLPTNFKMAHSQMYSRKTILLGVAVFALLSSCKEQEWYKKEFTLVEQKDLAQQLLHTRGYYYQGSVGEQLLFDEALMYDSTNAGVWQGIGTPLLKRGFAMEMHAAYEGAVANDPERWQGGRGYCYLYFYRDYGRAIADFDATDSLSNGEVDYPHGQSVDYMRGIGYYGLADYNKALAYLSKYVESVMAKEGEAWVDPYAVLYRGLSYEKTGEMERALEEFDRVIRIYPNLSDPFYHKARILTKSQNFTEAKLSIAKAKEYFKQGYYHQRPYVEVLEQIYLMDIVELEKELASLNEENTSPLL